MLFAFVKFVRMLKGRVFSFLLLLSVLPSAAQSYEKFVPPESKVRKEVSGGVFWHPRGLGINVKSASRRTDISWRVFDFDLVSMKHEKERRIRSSSFSAPGSYFYGKMNNTFILRGGFGRRWDLSARLYKNTISTRFQITAGPSIALLKPVYLEIYYPTPDNQAGFLVSERYDPEVHTDQSVIYGNSGFFKGIGEMQGRLGMNVKACLQFDWSNYVDQIQAIELGMVVDAFGKDLPILARTENKNVFTSLYICLNVGNRW